MKKILGFTIIIAATMITVPASACGLLTKCYPQYSYQYVYPQYVYQYQPVQVYQVPVVTHQVRRKRVVQDVYYYEPRVSYGYVYR